MSKTLRERLIAGEHHGCASWAEVARSLGVDERRLRVVRKTLEGDGHRVTLSPSIIRKTDKCIEASIPPHETKPTVKVCAGYTPTDPVGPNPENKWRNVEAFDALSDVVPEKHAIKGVSTLLDADGSIKQQWVKTTAQDDERTTWLDAIRSMSETLPRVESTPAPEYVDYDLLAVYPVGDPHVGLLAWHEDAGENFDLDIAERNLVAAFAHLVNLAPAAKRALLIFIGDNTHADGQSNTTTKGTRVDVDGRTVKMARTIINAIRHAVRIVLTKHAEAEIKIERGNHDELLSAMIALALSLLYEDEPRVTVDVSPEVFHWYRFGACLIGTHHGDRVKPMDLLGVMAVDRKDDWSSTTHRRFYLGHLHHQIVKEVPGLICEYLPTLASSDAWHRSMGYRSQRAMYMDVFHRERGHVNRHIVGIEQLRVA
jgi:hypothetical protein